MRAFGEALCVYRPPVDLKTIEPVIDTKPNGEKQIVLNFITPHQKWGIHSHLHRQSADADADPRRADRLDQRRRRREGRHRRQRLDRSFQRQRRADARAVVSQRVQAGHVHDVSRAGEDREHAGLARSPASAAASTTR